MHDYNYMDSMHFSKKFFESQGHCGNCNKEYFLSSSSSFFVTYVLNNCKLLFFLNQL